MLYPFARFDRAMRFVLVDRERGQRTKATTVGSLCEINTQERGNREGRRAGLRFLMPVFQEPVQLLLEIVRIYECLMREAYTHTHTQKRRSTGLLPLGEQIPILVKYFTDVVHGLF